MYVSEDNNEDRQRKEEGHLSAQRREGRKKTTIIEDGLGNIILIGGWIHGST